MAFIPTTFSAGEILHQLKDDLWCKEVATGYTVSYTWAANQLGHFTIGFAPTILLGPLLAGGHSPQWWWALAALAPVAFMLIKERGDIQAEIDRFRADPGIVRLNLPQIRANAWTATWFSIVGAVVGACVFLACAPPHLLPAYGPLLSLLLLCVPCALVLRYWFMRKMCFQRAGLPFTFRLSYFARRQVAGDRAAARRTLARFQAGGLDHLLIAGRANSGKTSLAVALGTELGFQRSKVRFIALADFLDVAPSGREPAVHIAYELWPWQQAEVLIFDDAWIDGLRRLGEPRYQAVRGHLAGMKLVWVFADPAMADEFPAAVTAVFGPGRSLARVDLQDAASATAAAERLSAWRRTRR